MTDHRFLLPYWRFTIDNFAQRESVILYTYIYTDTDKVKKQVQYTINVN